MEDKPQSFNDTKAFDDSGGFDRPKSQSLRDTVKALEKQMQCNCDLDNWEPERDTGHSWVCRIHKAARARHPAG